MLEVAITRGLPASGKTTIAEQWVRDRPGKRVKVSRDDYRAGLFAGTHVHGDHQAETIITIAQTATVRAVLAAAQSVIIDDTNLDMRAARTWADIADQHGATFTCIDTPLEVPLETCVRRAADRHAAGGRYVPETAIRSMHARYLASGHLPPIISRTAKVAPNTTPFTPVDGAEKVLLVDLDGTVALMGDRRSPYDWGKVGLDQPNQPVIDTVIGWALTHGRRPVFMSGRDEVCRDLTETWLRDYVVGGLVLAGFDAPIELYMRPKGDQRRDDVVKLELFDQHIRDRYNPVLVLDDRDQVIRLWRDRLRLPTFQVANGNF